MVVNETLPEIEVWYGNDLIDIVYYSANLPRFTQGGLWHAATVFVGVEGSELWMTLRRFPFPGVSRASSPQSYLSWLWVSIASKASLTLSAPNSFQTIGLI